MKIKEPNEFLAWSSIKRRWVPFALWEPIISSRCMDWPVLGRFLRWALNDVTRYC